jgi:hypothetical protein
VRFGGRLGVVPLGDVERDRGEGSADLLAEVAIEAADCCDQGAKRLDGFDGEVEDDEL